MRGSLKLRGTWILCLIVVGWGLVPEAEAQSRRRAQPQRSGVSQPSNSAPRFGNDRDSFAPGQAAAGAPSPFSPFGGGTADRQIRRYRGDNNEFNFEVGPSGRSVGSMNASGAGGFTIDRVHEGYYMPGFGVNNGFAAPERVHGGFYTPGWGVMGGMGTFNGAAATQQLRGGTYIPGFGVGGGSTVVGGGPAVIGNQGGPAVIGNFGNPVGGFSAPTTGSAVSGGSYIPGFGVSGGR